MKKSDGGYATYRNRYFKIEAKLNRMGHSMDQPLLTKSQFLNLYEKNKPILEREIKLNNKKSKNVSQYTTNSVLQYATYRMKYYEQEAKLNRMGHSMDQPLLTKSQFINVYEETKNILQMDIESGKKKGIGNVYQYIVREQAYPITQGMYKGLKSVFEAVGQEVKFTRFSTYEEIRKEAPQALWDYIHDEYDRLRSENKNLSASDVKMMIAQMFFGS